MLTDEHIIPYFIGGFHVIDDASCTECAKVTTRFERNIAKGLWGDARNAYNAPTRRKKDRKKHIYLDNRYAPGQKLKILSNEYPAPMIFYYMDTAGFLLGLPEHIDRSNNWTLKAVVDQAKLDAFEAKYPGQLTASMKFSHDSYARLIAKIGFCQVMCSLDPGDFRPICLPYIMGEKSNLSHIVGTRHSVPEPEKGIGYKMSSHSFGTSEYMLILAEVRILADNHTPAYHVVVGDVSGAENVSAIREKLVATYEVTIPNDSKGPQQPTDEHHWMPRLWPLAN